MAGYCITPFWNQCGNQPSPHADSTSVAIPGNPDTTFSAGQTTYGTITESFHIQPTDTLGDAEALPDTTYITEAILDTTLKQGTQVNIRHTNWIYGRVKDFTQSLEWNIKERPCQEVKQIDTLYITKYENTRSFWDDRFIPYLGAGVLYNPATKAVDWGIQLGIGVRLN